MTSLQLQKAPQAGDAAPDFTARSTSGEMVTPSSFRGKRNVLLAYGVLDEAKFHSKRFCFLIDKQGIIRWSHVEEHNGLKRLNEAILAEVAKLS